VLNADLFSRQKKKILQKRKKKSLTESPTSAQDADINSSSTKCQAQNPFAHTAAKTIKPSQTKFLV